MSSNHMHRTALNTTQLGQTGLEITRVGFGAWANPRFRERQLSRNLELVAPRRREAQARMKLSATAYARAIVSQSRFSGVSLGQW